MKLSTVVLAVSTVFSAVADAVHNKVVLPSARVGSKVKAAGLDRAFQEHDVAYWNAVDNTIAARKYAAVAESTVGKVLKARETALKAINKHAKVSR